MALTPMDIMLAALLALVFFWLFTSFGRLLKVVVTRSTELGYRPGDVEMVLQRCYSMFPNEILNFNGVVFQRGMNVRAVTNRDMVIEGRFVGTNKDNVVCFLTSSSVIAHELGNIEEMQALEG